MFEIKNGYVDNHKNEYSGIRNIHYKSDKDLFGNTGKLVAETRYEGVDDDSSVSLNNGVYLFKSLYDPNIALRIYKDFSNYKYICHSDASIVSRLQERQHKITLTQFPTGVVTIGKYVIGQEVPYYENHSTMLEFFKNSKKEIPTKYYIEMLKILKELYKEGIVYTDIHSKNFLISNLDERIKLIDFEFGYVVFDEDKKYYTKTMINNLRSAIIKLNNLSDVNFNDEILKTQTLDEVEECVLENHEKLLKKA